MTNFITGQWITDDPVTSLLATEPISTAVDGNRSRTIAVMLIQILIYTYPHFMYISISQWIPRGIKENLMETFS